MTMESEEWDAESFTWQQIDNYYSRMAHISAFYEVEVTKNIKDIFFLMYMKKNKKLKPLIAVITLSFLINTLITLYKYESKYSHIVQFFQQ